MARIKYTEEQKQEALELYDQLKNLRAVGEMTGIGYTTISRWVNGKNAEKQKWTKADSNINPNLLRLAGGNDLTAYIGRDITQMQPRDMGFPEAAECQGRFQDRTNYSSLKRYNHVSE